MSGVFDPAVKAHVTGRAHSRALECPRIGRTRLLHELSTLHTLYVLATAR